MTAVSPTNGNVIKEEGEIMESEMDQFGPLKKL